MSFVQDVKLARDFLGKTINDVPVPAFILDRAKLRTNSNKNLDKVRQLGDQTTFRVHVETLKCTEVVRLTLNNGEYGKVVVSTLEEIRQLMKLVEEGVVTDILYSTPIGKSQVKELAYLKNFCSNLGANLRLVVDNVRQLSFLLDNSAKWSVMIKIDIEQDKVVNEEDGKEVFSQNFDSLLQTIISDKNFNDKIELHGFYCHPGASSGSNDLSISQQIVDKQFDTVIDAAQVAREKLSKRKQHLQTIKTLNNNIKDPNQIPFLLSIGATPSIHELHIDNNNNNNNNNTNRLHNYDTLELHAGSFVALDLRQTHADLKDMAGVVLSEICSYQPVKNEYIINAGVLALSREQGPNAGLAYIKGAPGWAVTKVYQEHGIISYIGEDEEEREAEKDKEKAKFPFEIGDRIVLYPQNTCITSSCHRLYFITDNSNEIVDIWNPWRYW